MPHDISIFVTRYIDFKNEISENPSNDPKYTTLNAKHTQLNTELKRFIIPDKNGNHPKLTQDNLNALILKYTELIDSLTAIINSAGTDDAIKKLRYIALRYIDVIKNDAAILKSANLAEPKDFFEIIDEGRSKIYEIPLDAEITDNSPISVELDTDELTEGTFIKENADKLRTFFLVTEVFGMQAQVQQVKPVTLIQGENVHIGSFVQKSYGFKIGRETLQSKELKYTVRNFENPTLFKSISDAQAMDYILGVKGRKENVILRFDDNPPHILSGFTLGATDEYFSDRPDLDITDLGVISQSFYNYISEETEASFKEKLRNKGISEAQANHAWTRLTLLRNQVHDDLNFFNGINPGFTAVKHIRVVQNNEWQLHTAGTLAAIHQGSYFSVFSQIPAAERQRLDKAAYKRTSDNPQVNHAPIIAEQPKPGIAENDPEAVKLSLPPLSKVNSFRGSLSSRYTISYKDGKALKTGFFTVAKEYNYYQTINEIFDDFIRSNPHYREILTDLRDYYRTNSESVNAMITATFGQQQRLEIPFKVLGYSEEEARRYSTDYNFGDILRNLTRKIKAKVDIAAKYINAGFGYHQRIELKNVAVSDFADALNVSSIIAKSYTMEIESEGHLTEGVFMETAEGLDIGHLPVAHPILKLDPDKFDDCFNDGEALKEVADLQILDFITMNRDRHRFNMLYKFENIGSETPIFKGIVGIDNDYSFGTNVPRANDFTHSLPAINKMKVISEEMYNQLCDPEKLSELESKMRNRGLSDAEVNAFRERVQMAINAVKDHHLRVVKKDEWGKGKNTFSELSSYVSEDDSYYKRIKVNVCNELKSKAISYKKRVAEGSLNPDYNPEKFKIKYTMGNKVDSFGKNLENDKELRKIEKRTSEELLSTIEDDISKLDEKKYKKVTEHSALQSIINNTNFMEYCLEAADPPLQWSSGAYRDMKRANKALRSFAQSLIDEKNAWDRQQEQEQQQRQGQRQGQQQGQQQGQRQGQQQGQQQGQRQGQQQGQQQGQRQGNRRGKRPYIISEENRIRMEQLLNAVTDTTNAYMARKRRQFADEHRSPKNVEYPRLSACTTVAEYADNLKNVFKASSLKSPMQYLRFKLNIAQGKLSSSKNDADFKNTLSEIIYYRMLSETSFTTKRDYRMYTALTIGEVKKGKDKILASKAFGNLMKMPKEELLLHAVARNPRKLISYYKKEIAKEKQKEIHHNAGMR